MDTEKTNCKLEFFLVYLVFVKADERVGKEFFHGLRDDDILTLQMLWFGRYRCDQTEGQLVAFILRQLV